MTTMPVKDTNGTTVNVEKPLPPGQTTMSASHSVAIASDQGTIPLVQDSGVIWSNGVAIPVKPAIISASASGVNIVVAAVATKRILVLKWGVKVNGAVNFKWQSHTAGDITGLIYNSTAGDGMAEGFCPIGHFKTAVGESLDLNSSAAIGIGGSLMYAEV